MALISSADALTASTSTQTGFTFVNKLITGATSEGVTFVFIDEKYLLPEMVDSIRSAGYVVTKKTDVMGNHATYLVSWAGSPTIELI
jgi:hypothetical protein